VISAPFGSGNTCQTTNALFGCGVGTLSEVAEQAGTGGEVDHAAVGLLQVGVAGLHIIEGCVQARIQGQVELLGGVLGQRDAGSRGLCVVDQHLNAAKGVNGLLHYILHGGFVVAAGAHIGLHRQHLDAVLALQLLLGLFQLFHIAAGDHKVCTLFCVGRSNAVSNGTAAAILQDCAPCTGDECGLTR